MLHEKKLDELIAERLSLIEKLESAPSQSLILEKEKANLEMSQRVRELEAKC